MDEVKINKDIDDYIRETDREFKQGFEMLKKYPKSVTIFGSSHSMPQSPHFREAKELASRIVKELGYTIVTGGGPGIMAAANLGAQEAGGNSIGVTIELPKKQGSNPYMSDGVDFKFFFVRKAILTFSAEAYIFFPGGYGTFDELFEVLTLVQTQKIPKIPIILFGKDFWSRLRDFIVSHMKNVHHTITEDDLKLFTVTNNMDEVISIIKNEPVMKWWDMSSN